MEKNDIIKKYNSISKSLNKRHIADALRELKEVASQANTDEFNIHYNNFENTYSLILKYTIKGVEDPQRPYILKQLIKSIHELNDRVKAYFMDKVPSESSSLKKLVLARSGFVIQKLKELQDEGYIDKEFSELMEGMSIESSASEKNNYTALLGEFFNYVWLTDNLSDEDASHISSFMQSPVHEIHSKALVVSALTLSALRYFSPVKTLLLANWTKTSETQIAERAFVGLMLSLFIHEKRLEFYPEIKAQISLLPESNPQITQFVQFFLLQIIKAVDTEKFTKKFREEIMPDIIKNAPDLKDKLDLENILPEDMDEGKNPNWEKLLNNNQELMDKLEELSKLQMEGTDVFMSTFSLLKNFSFFRYMPNWFLPFYKENPLVNQALDSEEEEFKETFLNALEKSGHMCNSDKYSFCLNVKGLPAEQKKMMLRMFSMELDSINEISEQDDMLNKSLISKRIITHYIQDIYRFYKLYPNKNEFTDVFNLDLDFLNKPFFQDYFSDNDMLAVAADYYFDNSQFEHAAEAYCLLIDRGMNTQVVFEKTGFSYQQNDNFEKAIENYKKAELFEGTSWISLKIAYCYTKLQEHDKALIHFMEAEKLDPENTKIQLNIANAHLSKGDTETALNHYYKVEMLAQTNFRVWRPISWCLFILGRFEEAENYFLQLLDSSHVNAYDLMNYAHVLWCMGKPEEASNHYLKSIRFKNNSFASFHKSFSSDKKYLTEHGIGKEEILLMLDYLKMEA